MESPKTFRRIFILAIAGIVTIGAIDARPVQSTDTKPPAFEVASVKPSKPGDQPVSISGDPGGRLTTSNVPLRRLIALAYGTPQPRPDTQIVDGPKWIDSDRFDIVAKAERPATNQQIQLMLRALLAERFKLRVHIEDRELPIYALVRARSDGKPGPQLRRPEIECPPPAEARPIAPSPSGQTPARVAAFCGIRGGPGRLTGSSADLSMLATTLTRAVDRVVRDRSGLTGNFDFNLEWTPDLMPPLQSGQAPPGALPPLPADGPSIFTALQEQLGLKLESTKGPVDVLVIDSVDHPTPD
jgi:bla regulator protein blaR1